VGQFWVKPPRISSQAGTGGRTISPTDFGFGDTKLIGFNFGLWVPYIDDPRRPEINCFESKLMSCVINCLYKLLSLF
jgi:hypothetical protein